MERALYEPDLGYYAASDQRPTRAGDFLTAPELHPLFGHVIARRLDSMWHAAGQPDPFAVREFGAGSGTLFLAIVDGLRQQRSSLAEAIRYQPVDLARQRSTLLGRLAGAGLSGTLSEGPLDDPLIGVVLANEFLDALPVHLVTRQAGEMREVYVDWQDGRFGEQVGELSDARLSEWFSGSGVELAEGQRAAVNLAMLDWVTQLGSHLQTGFAIVIDYGASAAELYAGQRMTGTLRAFRDHHVSSDVLTAVGHQDITAHVDFDALERGARAAGLTIVERKRQAEFLIESGLEEAYAAARVESDQDWSAALSLRSAVRRLIDPQALGGYQVVVLSKGV